MKRYFLVLLVVGACLPGCVGLGRLHGDVYVATFEADVTPPMGAPLCSGDVKPAESVDDPLHARGIAILPENQKPIVLVTVEHVGIANGGQDRWRAAVAAAAGTTVDRVSVHVTHVHDAPFVDFTVEDLLAQNGLSGKAFDPVAAQKAIDDSAAALREAVKRPILVDRVGYGEAPVKEVASNRRILGEDGKVKAIRWSSTVDPAVRAEPEGVIDPLARVVSFWRGDRPVAALTYYATHPQSKYGQGHVSADFPGMARTRLADTLALPVLHFDGAGGNITAGKYNDGNIANRPVLAGRLYDGLYAAWRATKVYPLSAYGVAWDRREVALPQRKEVDEAKERATLANAGASVGERANAAVEVAWIERARAGIKTPLSCLHLGPLRLVNMPGELFVEYQLAATGMTAHPVAMAAYGEYGPGYIGTEVSYPQGGYETQVHVSRTAPCVEPVLMDALESMLAR